MTKNMTELERIEGNDVFDSLLVKKALVMKVYNTE